LISLTILGNNSALPAYGRNPTSQYLQTEKDCFLIDCGEGTQIQLTKYKLKRSKISHIFISHLHGDHYFGLIGLLTSMSLLGRTQEIHIHAPFALEKIIQLQLEASESTLCYPMYFHAHPASGVIAETDSCTVTCFPVQHGISCWGFLFTEKKASRKIIGERIKSYGIPEHFIESLKLGLDYIHPKGTIVPNEELTIAGDKPCTYAFCGDTLYHEEILNHVRGVDLLYHETTYLQDHEDKAAMRFHSTTVQAGMIAKKAGVKQLLIGHFSSKYEDLVPFLNETKAIFEPTILAEEGSCIRIQAKENAEAEKPNLMD
jgi:ribonuclease Z